MKKILVFIFLVMSVFTYSEDIFNVSSRSIEETDIGLKRFLEFNPSNLKEVRTYIKEHFVYKSETVDRWSAPTELMRNGYGDCEDFAIFLMYYAHRLGYPVMMIIVEQPDGGLHALCTINGKLFEPQTVSPRTLGNDRSIKQMTLNECFDKCYF